MEWELTVYMVCLNASQQVCEPADAFWKLAVLSKSQRWIALQLSWGNIALLWKGPPVSASSHWLCTNLEPLVCACQRKNFDGVCAVKKIFRTNPGFQSQVQPDLHDSAAAPSSFSCISNNLHLPACSCASLKFFLPLTSYAKCI